MSTDFFTSSRGPGLIGSAIALLVLLGFGTLFFFAFDERFQGGENINTVIRDEAHSITRLHQSIAGSKARLEEFDQLRDIDRKLIDAEAAARFAAEKLAETQGRLAAAEADLAACINGFATYKQAYRTSERAAAEGETIAELRTISGKLYKEVKVKDVDAVRMQIWHSGGIAGVPLDDLPLDLQDRFQVDAAEMESQLVEEHGRRAEVNLQADMANLRIQIANLEKSNADAQHRVDQAKALLDKGADDRETLLKRRNALRDQLKASIRGGVSKAPQLEPQIEKLNRSIASIEASVPVVRARIKADQDVIRGSRGQIETLRRDLKTRLAASAAQAGEDDVAETH